MNDTVKQQNDYCGVTAWHDAGFKGNGVVVWDMEGLSDHGNGTRQRILDAAPEADVLNATNTITTKGGVIISETVDYGVLKMSADQFINHYKVSILSASKSGNGDTCGGKRLLYSGLKRKYNLCLFNSAGNDGDSGVKGGTLPESEAIYVGAAMLYKGTELRMWQYSSIGDEKDEVDFSTFTGGLNGTSFSTPYLAGMAALLRSRYEMTQDEMYAYFKMVARPIDTGHSKDGYDLWSGYGIPILPDPSKKLLRMEIGNWTYTVDGKPYTMDTIPFIKDGRTFVPIAFVALALGCSVYWDAKTQTVAIRKDNRNLTLTIGNRALTVTNKSIKQTIKMDTAPFIQDKRTFVPLSYIALALGCKVAWVEKERKVIVLEGN